MMHPSRQAYVEEAESEVRKPLHPTPQHFNNIHMIPEGPRLITRAVPSISEQAADGSDFYFQDRGIDLANVPLDHDYEMPSATAGIAPERASAILSQFSRKRRAAGIAVPTDDKRVRSRLRELGEPITLFGEGPGDRRDRLRELLTIQAEIDAAEDEDGDATMQDAAEEEPNNEQEEEFYTKGVAELLEARQGIARFSLPRAKRRLESQKLEAGIPLKNHVKFRKGIKERLQGFELQGSQMAGERPVSITRFSPNGEMIAAGNWGGGIKILDVPKLEEKRTLRGHTDRVGGISWFPGATLPGTKVSADSVNLASGGAEGNIHLWSLNQDTPKATLAGHSQRVCRVEFHPSGQYLASASEDTTWRLWDMNTTTELILQEGHSRGVFALSFNSDGSLLASAGMDSIGRIWDLRTGRTVMILDGHIRPIYALDWGVDGHRVLSGSGDGWVKCWDVRKVSAAGGVGAHRSVVSDLRWYKGIDDPAQGFIPEIDEKGEMKPKKSGTFFVSSGFDKNVNIFSADDWSLVQSLSGHTGNVHSVDVNRDASWIRLLAYRLSIMRSSIATRSQQVLRPCKASIRRTFNTRSKPTPSSSADLIYSKPFSNLTIQSKPIRKYTYKASTTTDASIESNPTPLTHYEFFPETLSSGPPPVGPFVIDLRALRKEFLQMQAVAHPDRHPSHLKRRAEATSARINEAYKTLQDPLLRAQYLLGLRGIDVAEDETAKVDDPELLMEVLDTREAIERAEEEGELQGLKESNSLRIRESEAELEDAFKNDDLGKAKSEAVKLRAAIVSASEPQLMAHSMASTIFLSSRAGMTQFMIHYGCLYLLNSFSFLRAFGLRISQPAPEPNIIMATAFRSFAVTACRPNTLRRVLKDGRTSVQPGSYLCRQFAASPKIPRKSPECPSINQFLTRRSHTSQPSNPRFTYGIAASFTAKDRRYNPETNVFNFNPYNHIRARRKDKRTRPDSGQDAFFVSRVGESPDVAFGVADGVGGWSDSGVDSADFSHGFCDYMAHAAYTHEGGTTAPYNARSLMQRGYDDICRDKSVPAGGSTACVGIARGDGTLEVANLGDSGFVQLRLNAVHNYSEPQTHAFNTPYQLSVVPEKMRAQSATFGGTWLRDFPKDAIVSQHSLRHGDVLVFASDGVWDNLSSQDILRIVSKLMVGARAWEHTQEGIRVGSNLHAFTIGNDGKSSSEETPTLQSFLAMRITGEAKAASVNRTVDGPFAREIQRYYPYERWSGGKVDDICVVVAIVVQEGNNEWSLREIAMESRDRISEAGSHGYEIYEEEIGVYGLLELASYMRLGPWSGVKSLGLAVRRRWRRLVAVLLFIGFAVRRYYPHIPPAITASDISQLPLSAASEDGFWDVEVAREVCAAHTWRVFMPRDSRRKVYDLFMINGEMDWLEIRLASMEQYVDYFVVLESRVTFTGLEKKMALRDNWDRFAKWHDKIIYHELEDPPVGAPRTWDLEDFQRNAMFKQVFPTLEGDKQARWGDIILVSDVDELIRPATLVLLRNCEFQRMLTLRSQFYYYGFQWLHIGEQWNHPQATIFEGLRNTVLPADLRNLEGSWKILMWLRKDKEELFNAGWHCSSCFGTLEDVLGKMSSFSHVSLNAEQFRDRTRIVDRVRKGLDLWDREGETYERIYGNEDVPEFLKENKERFPYLFDREASNAGFSDYGLNEDAGD
ncbi:hypothetical protein B7494_g6364 [Chlorociboria aeruginascens]|nr:hypothetical protein B7494_g6364 [Chlorociboria aeruginascens]